MTDDQDLMAPLFMSNEGEITTFPEATSEDDWVDRMDGTVAVRFYRLLVRAPIAVGILRLIRERDEAIAALKATTDQLQEVYEFTLVEKAALREPELTCLEICISEARDLLARQKS